MTLLNHIKKLLGYHYLLNLNTNEVHCLIEERRNCGTELMLESNQKLISKRKYLRLLKEGKVNSCHWCLNDATYSPDSK